VVERSDSPALGHRKQTAPGLDVSFGEDLDQKRAGNAAQNFSLINRIALNLLAGQKLQPRRQRKTPQSWLGQ
jgi:hypothetical protein